MQLSSRQKSAIYTYTCDTFVVNVLTHITLEIHSFLFMSFGIKLRTQLIHTKLLAGLYLSPLAEWETLEAIIGL